MKRLLDKIFKRKPAAPSRAVTLPLGDADSLAPASRGSGFYHLISGSSLDAGRRRDNNEDALLCINVALGAEQAAQPLGLYAIADGMGGHRNGELASEAAVRAWGSALLGKLYKLLFGPNPQPAEESLRELMEAAVGEAHRAVTKSAPGGGCTLTAALVVGNQMVVAHLGDSRAYAVHRDGRMQQLTRDHTLVQRLQEMGQLSAEEAASHPQKSVLYRALGQGGAAQPEIFISSLPNPGSLLLCSDGLWGVVSDDEIQRIVNSTDSPHLACQKLVQAANHAGGPDNISVILVRATA
ncbi:MAG: serine/threonine-protein phosphatase [Anaerolineales bacterium]|nr:serine/threonine-protein phosphatase [Anaerolineales bacterium]MCW5855839.1 serine/threonine-protein phosphatase [Anaerolineales bacterium]